MNKIKVQKENVFLQVFIIGLIILLCIRDLLFISLSKWILVAFGCAFAALASIENIIYMFCFMFPLACGLPGKYLFLFFLAVLIVKKKRIDITVFVFILYWILKELIAAFWVINPDIIDIMGYLVFVIVFFTLIYDEPVLDYKKCINIYLTGTIVLCVIIIVRTILTAPSNWLWLFSNGWFRFGMADEATTEMVVQLNANSLAYYCIVGIACGIVPIVSDIENSKIVGIISVVVCLFTGILTVSRSFLLITGVILILVVITMPKNKKMMIAITILVFGLVVAGLIFSQNNPELVEGITARFTDKTFSTGGGRNVLLKRYMEAFIENPRLYIMGTGVTYYKEITGIYNSMHNATEQIIVCYGLIGGTLFIIGMLIPVIKCWVKNDKKKAIQLGPFIAVILFIQTIQFVNPEMLMFPYIIAVYVLRIRSEIDEEVHDNS